MNGLAHQSEALRPVDNTKIKVTGCEMAPTDGHDGARIQPCTNGKPAEAQSCALRQPASVSEAEVGLNGFLSAPSRPWPPCFAKSVMLRAAKHL
jgi:hypothetical protein